MPVNDKPPTFFIIAGPNGAGKSTAAPFLLKRLLNIDDYINADTIAAGLSAFDPDSVAFAAGRIMIERMRELSEQRQDFAIETTLASRTFAAWLRRLSEAGYQTRLLFLSLPDPEVAIRRVAQRVEQGGHDIPEPTIRRRFDAGIRNFFQLYAPLVDAWRVYDTASVDSPKLLASRVRADDIMIADHKGWHRFLSKDT
jgi:predicted ABC-type ATPase